MATNLYKCMRLNWFRGQYDWTTFEAADDAEAGAIVGRLTDCLAHTLSHAEMLHPAA